MSNEIKAIEDCFRQWGFRKGGILSDVLIFDDAGPESIRVEGGGFKYHFTRYIPTMNVFLNLTPTNFPHVMEALGIEKGGGK